MRNAKVLKKSVVKALKGRSKQELASEDVEAQAESGVKGPSYSKRELVRVHTSIKSTTGSVDEVSYLLFVTKLLQLFIFLGLQRQKDRWKRVTSKSKNSSLGKDGRSLREDGTRENSYEVNEQIHSGDLIC